MTDGTVTVRGAVDVSPSPFGDEGTVAATVSTREGAVEVAANGRSVTLQPDRAELGFGSVTLTGQFGERDEYVLEVAKDPGLNRQHPANLHRVMRECDDRGLADLLAALRRDGVQVGPSAELRRGTVGHRAKVWVATAGLLFVELVAVGVPARVALDLFGDGYDLASRAVEIGLGVVLEVAIVLWAFAAWLPIAVRLDFERVSCRDPVRFIERWGATDKKIARAKEAAQTWLVSLPSVPLTILLVVAANAALLLAPILGMTPAEFETLMTRVGEASVSEDVASLNVDQGVILVLALVGAAWLLWIFAVSVWRTVKDRSRFRPRWMPLAGAVVCVGIPMTPMTPFYGAVGFIPLLTLLLVVAFASGRLVVGFVTFGAAAVLFVLAFFGVLSAPMTLLVLVPVLAPAAVIVLRFTPHGVRVVEMAHAQARVIGRRKTVLGCVTTGLGIALVVTGIVLYRMAN